MNIIEKKLLCKIGIHNHRYGSTPGYSGIHMRCKRCYDISYADSYGLASCSYNYISCVFEEGDGYWSVKGKVIEWMIDYFHKNNWCLDKESIYTINHCIKFPNKYFRIFVMNKEDEMVLKLMWF